MIELTPESFGTLAICAIRYCHGRQTYMPSLVQGILKSYLGGLSDKDLTIMINDCRYMTGDDFGDPLIDKPGWIKFKEDLENEQARRAGLL